MALTRNTRDVYATPGQLTGVYSFNRGAWIKGGLRNRITGPISPLFCALPVGGLNPGAWVLPQKPGGLAAHTEALSLDAIAALVPAYNLAASTGGTLSVTLADLQQIVSLIATSSASLAAVQALLQAAVEMAGTGALVLTPTASQLDAIVSSVASASCSLSPAVTLTALGHLTAAAGGPAALSPEGLANAVLDALLADHTLAGSVGEALNSVGASGNPWSSATLANNTSGTFGALVQKLLKTGTFIALKD